MTDADPEKPEAPGEGVDPSEITDCDGHARSSGKSRRLAWEKQPWVDAQSAQRRAIAAAQRPAVDVSSAAVVSYVRAAFDAETGALRDAVKGERNAQLFRSAVNLFELVAADALAEAAVVDALRDACMANGSISDDGEAQFERTVASARRRGIDNPRDLSRVGMHARTDRNDSEAEPKLLDLNDFRRLERGFWMERESLRTIYLAALSRMCAPWAVLAHCAAIALASVRPHVALPPLIGGPGSLNWFGIVVADSSGGKGGAESVARALIPHNIPVVNLGSGEGVVDAYRRPADKETGEPAGVRESVLFVAHEIDGFKALAQRSGSTLLPVLRSAFSGETLGFSNRTASSLHLGAHSYRLTLVVSAQPARCESLLSDGDGGTPQRFQWFPSRDDRVSDQPPSWPGPLTLTPLSAWQYPTELAVPYDTVEMIRSERARAMRGEVNALDGHALYVREKFAFALAVLDGRAAMSADDWRLAGTALRVSDHMRAYVTQQVELAAIADAETRGKLRGVEHSAANEESARRLHKRRRRIADLIVRKLKEAGTEGLTQSELTQKFVHRERALVEETLPLLETSGEVTRLARRSGDRTLRWTLAGEK